VVGSARPTRQVAERIAIGVLLAVFAALWGWAAGDGHDDGAPGDESPDGVQPLAAQLADPQDAATVVDAEHPVARAVAASGVLFEAAPVVVLAAADDAAGQRRATAAAVEMGVPVLLSPGAPDGDGTGGGADPTGAGAVRDEVARLAPEALLAVGPAAEAWARQHIDVATIVTTEADVPPVAPAEPHGDVVFLVEAVGEDGARTVDPRSAAVAATAEAAGAGVIPVAGGDPRADRTAIASLAETGPPERVVAVGAGYGSAERLRRRVDVAATGAELPGGGQLLFPDRRMIALYGHPTTPAMGVLGEQPVEEAVTRAERTAQRYAAVVDEDVVPAFEIITTVASASPGDDGDYSNESEVADVRPWVEAAGRAGVYVVLDLQPGRTDFLTQAQRYEELLAEPHVGLALDAEWRLGSGERHMDQVGSVSAAEVDAVAGWLAGLTRERRLPQKLLVLHQFQPRMISDRGSITTDHDELAVLVHADGFGTPRDKLETWAALHTEPLPGAWWGWKNFVDEDRPTFSPSETMALDPAPWFVSYQ
jgi:hypothetical protein